MANTFAEKSERTWNEGNDCLQRGLVNMAANRIYYSVLQAIKGFAVGKRLWQLNESDNIHTKAMNIMPALRQQIPFSLVGIHTNGLLTQKKFQAWHTVGYPKG